MKKLLSFVLICVFSFIAIAQSKWTKIAESQDGERVYYTGNIKMNKSRVRFDGLVVYSQKRESIAYFEADCDATKLFVLGMLENGKEIILEKPINMPLVDGSAAEVAYYNVCGSKS